LLIIHSFLLAGKGKIRQVTKAEGSCKQEVSI